MFRKEEARPETAFKRLAKRLRHPHQDAERRRAWRLSARRAERNPRRGVR